MNGTPVLGVDWCRGAWVGAALYEDNVPEVRVEADLPALIDWVPDARCIAVDMPIGLPERDERECDREAREFVKSRRNSVFMTPPRAVLAAPDYEAANAIASELMGKKISRQAFALADNIFKVAEVAERDDRIIEVHPEVSFTALVGEEVRWPKLTWNGQLVRRRALERAGISLPGELDDKAGKVLAPDVLDALAAAWSARRYANGEAKSLPAGVPPGRREVICY